jgi:hypothetical protein
MCLAYTNFSAIKLSKSVDRRTVKLLELDANKFTWMPESCRNYYILKETVLLGGL